jgi:hypothetical protein
MADAIRKPCEKVEDGVLVGGEDVAEIGTVQDVFEGGKYFDPNRRPIFTGNESGHLSVKTEATATILPTLLSKTR